MYGSIEWDSMRTAIDPAEFPEIATWTTWQQQGEMVRVLPSGRENSNKKGAEQSDGFGTIQASLTLAKSRQCDIQRENGPAADGEALGAVEEWFADDGQGFCKPTDFEPLLRSIDTSLESFGGTRGLVHAGNAKSSARLLCPTNETETHE